MHDGMLQWDGVCVAVRGRALLEDVSACVATRGLTGIVGPNGAGKSTLLRAALSLITPCRGQVLLEGRAVSGWSARARAARIGYVPQSTQAHWDLTVRELLGMQNPRWSADVLEHCALHDLLDQRLRTLSGGERARAWLARALVHQPALLLADEPGAHLDLPHHHRLMGLLQAQARARAVVVVLHDLHMASRYCDQILLLSQGRLLAAGTPAEVMNESLLSHAFAADIAMRQAGDWQVFGAMRAVAV